MSNANRHPAGRRAITLIEVVVIVIIALVLLGFFISYLGRMREGAGQVGCANNLRLIGEAFYHGKAPRPLVDNKVAGLPLPASRIADGYATWAIQLAPYVAGKTPLSEWDLQKPYHVQPASIRETAVNFFFCPARSRPSLLSAQGDVPPRGKDNVPGALGDYACASGDGDPRFAYDSARANGAVIPAEVLERNRNLVLRWETRTTLAGLKRGVGNTILVGEKHVPWGKFGEAGFGDGSIYNGGHPANFARVGGPGFGLAQSPTDPFNTNFGSYHAGLCQFLMADTSVRPIANRISENILGQLIRRD